MFYAQSTGTVISGRIRIKVSQYPDAELQERRMLFTRRLVSDVPLKLRYLARHGCSKGLQLGHLDERRGEWGGGGTQKTCIVNDILSALDKGNISVLLLLDLSAAFGTTDHQILLSRVNSLLGIQSAALQ